MSTPVTTKASRDLIRGKKAANWLVRVGLLSVVLFGVPAGFANTEADPFTKEDYNWWAIQPVKDVGVPVVDNASWVKTPIDHFVIQKLREAELQPASPADSYELVRRVYFDLHGLPPSLDQVDAFVEAASVNFESAYTSLLEELLASPRYGERWAQHWLDVARYAETDGYRADQYRAGAYLYRDYVIQSFNEDKPYDQFIREQLAGDEMDADDPDVVIGTAFLRHGVYEYNQRDARFQWELILNEMTNVTGETFLGLGFGCAQCHDHKFDPILQKDYYALQSFLTTSYWPDGKKLTTPKQEEDYTATLATWTETAKPVLDEIEAIKRPHADAMGGFVIKQFPPDIQEMYKKPFEERTSFEKQMAEMIEKQVIERIGRLDYSAQLKSKEPEKLARYEELLRLLAELEKEKPEDLPKAFITTDISKESVASLLGGRLGSEEVSPAFLTILGDPKPVIKPTATTTGRRTALADWIANPKNPLSTRVMANRLWHYHFGTGLVPTPNDFGTLGEDPSHPELLDWLTNQFIDNGWKMKPIHRLIMTSATYLQTAQKEPDLRSQTVDPENRLLWRFSPTRLSAEQARDAMLVASGEMTHRMGGLSQDADTSVRSIYIKKLRNKPEKFLHSFDAPLGFDSAPDRLQTTTSLQSLMLVNSEWPLQRAAMFAKRIVGDSQAIVDDQIETAFKIAYNRPPTSAEVKLAKDFIDNQQAQLEDQFSVVSPISEFNDSALFSIDEGFSAVDQSFSLGDMALRLEPGSPHERLKLPEVELTGSSFSVEAVVILNGLHADASVNTLISQWSGDPSESGWSIGITSAQSKYDSRNFIVQLIGEDGVGNMDYQVVASGLRVPLDTPVYLAAVVTANKQLNESGGGEVVFYMKNLSDSYSVLETVSVSHPIAARIFSPNTKMILGGRDSVGHLWNGQIARISISDDPLPRSSLFVETAISPEDRANWRFSGANTQTAIPDGASWLLPTRLEKAQDPFFGAVTDFCHALITSNAFLYLH